MMKKKVGVITMHKVVNYGSFLQAYATQKLFENIDCDCELIDYIYPNNWQYKYGLAQRSLLKKVIRKIAGYLGVSARLRKEAYLKKAADKYFKLSATRYDTYESLADALFNYDVYVTGSDQTWNVRYMKADSNYLLGFAPKGAKKISFSASVAQVIMSDEEKSIFNKHLSEYDSISVREKNSVETIKALSGKKQVYVTLDPTLMLNRAIWTKAFDEPVRKDIPRSSYIVLYMMSYSFDPQPYIYTLLKELQTKTGMLVVSFTTIPAVYNLKSILVNDANIHEFIDIFANASYVVTSSFHGTAFALNFGIPLMSIVPENFRNKDSRQVDLIETVGANNTIVIIGTLLKDINPFYDNHLVQANLNKLRTESENYLKETI